ncbi:MAG TPA: HEAT repeat domain-containing protein, partial [Pirellulaceae bacterium]|nr:HEAT repeat domain-containing protein [Pirellulaceae bacterium]
MPRFEFRVASRIASLVSAASFATSLTLSFFIALAAAPPLVVAAPPLKLEKGDHICIIGNTLAERMQHYGWLETRIHARHPGLELVVRNLGYSGDEVGGFTEQPDVNKRLRSMSFGTADEWLSANASVPQANRLNADSPVAKNRFALTETRADVIFAMFGYGESFEGPAGIDKFKQDVASFIKHARSKKYNGKSSPRIVLFTPIAFENLPDQNLPRGDETNARLELYVRAMQEVAQATDVMLVDLFHPTLAAYKSLRSPATINGVHITEAGDALIGEIAERQLFGEMNVKHAVDMAPLYRAVRDKNWHWFNRYRATDGFSTYGDRAFLRFVDGQSNYEVAQRELEALDVLTSNRDRVVWAAAVGRTVKPDDSNLPQFIPVKTNKPGPLPGGKHLFLGGEAAIEKMTVHKEMKVELFATEERFPELINPVQMAFDTKGRLWVAAWPTYPHWKPTEPMDDKLLILEDSDGDGKADKCITFAGDLHNPTGFEFWGGGVLVAQGPDVLFLRDTNGDDRYDVKERVIHGLDTADTHHTANSFTLDPGGSVYFQEGTFHHTQVESPWGKTRRVANGAVFRYEPRTQKFDVYVTFGFANPHGHVFDQWGQDIVVDGTGSNPFHATLFSSRLDYPNKHNNPPQVYQQRTRPCPGMEILSSSHFPEEQRGNLLVGNVIGFQGILQYKLENRDSSLGASEVEPIVYSSDPNFRPTDIEVAPDGSIYFTDWQNPIIGHMQHNLRDPSRDRQHGRVYRVRHQTRPLVQPPKIAGATVPALLDVLKHPDDRIRHLARVELSARPTAEVVAALEKWVAALDGPNLASDPRGEHHMTEALWLSQSHNVVNPMLLERVLKSTDFQARAAAVRVIASWQDRLPKALDYLRAAAADEAPRVRLQAIWSASFLTQPEAIEVLLIAGEQPSDQYIEFLSNEVVRTLQPLVDKAKTDGRKLAFKSEAGARYYLKNLSNEQLLAEPRSRMVAIEMLYRPGLRDEHRRDAVRELAKVDG